MKNKARYEQESNREIADEILADPKATTRETVMAQRIRNGWGPNRWDRSTDHKFD